MNTPLVSIVIPAYNHARYLREAIQSVLDQDYPDIELIVLDDGSTDNTHEVLASCAHKFYWETQPNMGQAATLNKGWGMSRGSFLSYLAADDFLLPSAVRRSVEVLANNPQTVLTYCDFNLIDAQSRVLRRKQAPDFSYRDLALRMICQPGPGVFFRRDAYLRAGGWDVSLRQHPDYEYWLRLGLEGTFMRIPEVLAAYRVHEQSYSYSPVDPTRAEEIVKIVSAHFRNSRLPPDIARARDEAVGSSHVVSARLHLRSGRYAAAAKQLRHAFSIDPRSSLRLRTWWLVMSGLFNRVGYRFFGWIKGFFPGR